VTIDALQKGLRDLGYVEGANVIIEARFADGRPERIPPMIDELLRLKVDVLVVGSNLAALPAKRATTTVPIVFAGVFDPIASGIVSSLARPGGNVTGVTMGVGGTGFAGKWVELLKTMAPGVSHAAVLWNSGNPFSGLQTKEVQATAQTLKVKVDVIDAGANLDGALAAVAGTTEGGQAPQASCTTRPSTTVIATGR